MQLEERPRFHLVPPVGWMNDPNGLVLREGRLHVFYQHNPDEPRWGRMHWGHAVSADLVTWQHLPVALSPGDPGTDDFGCWSGCIVEDGGVATMFYTGVAIDRDERRASICRATSLDGLQSWTKDPLNPRVAGPPDGIAHDAFRDPFVYRDGDGWSMLVGAGTTDGLGAVLLYRSPDLGTWSYVGPFLTTDVIARADGADGPCWECPQLLRFGDDAVLIVSVVDRAPGVRPSHVSAFVGRVDGDRFVVDHVEQLGMGPDFYAPATMVTPDGRHLLMGWIPEDPPHDGSSRTWAGSMTFPRIVSIGEDGRLSLALATEVTALRAAPHHLVLVPLEADAPPWRYEPVTQHFEIAAAIDPGDAAEIAIELIDGDATDPEVRLVFQPADRRLSVARRGIISVAGTSSQSARLLPGASAGPFRLRLIVDGSSMEIEADGRTTATFRLPTTQGDRVAVAFTAVGGSARIVELDAWSLRPPDANDQATPIIDGGSDSRTTSRTT